MKVKNETHWNTAHLRAFVVRVAREELEASRRKHTVVTFKFGGRRPDVSGHASCPGHYATIFVSSEAINRVSLVHTLRHEFAHLRGMRHKQMRGSSLYTYAGDWWTSCAWGDTLPLDKAAATPWPTLDERRAKKLVHAERMLAQWERRAKIAAGRVKRWRGRVRDYTRSIELAATRKPEASA